MGIIIEDLYRPYANPNAPDVKSIVIWLRKEGIPNDIINLALTKIFTDIKNGKNFDSTKDLWKEIRTLARELNRDAVDIPIVKSKWRRIIEVIKGEL